MPNLSVVFASVLTVGTILGCGSPSTPHATPPELTTVSKHLSQPTTITSSAATTKTYEVGLPFDQAVEALKPALTSAGWTPFDPRKSKRVWTAVFVNREKGNYLLITEAPGWKVLLNHTEVGER